MSVGFNPLELMAKVQGQAANNESLMMQMEKTAEQLKQKKIDVDNELRSSRLQSMDKIRL